MVVTEVLIPLKPFATAKGRLAPHLHPSTRRRLTVRLARGVIGAATTNFRTWVVCEDFGVAAFAESLGANIFTTKPCPTGTQNLNFAVTQATNARKDAGVDRVIVAHGDLPLCDTFEPVSSAVANIDDVVIVTNAAGTGTKVLSLPTIADFRFGYGRNSAQYHQTEARRLGLRAICLKHPKLGFDINTIHNLNELQRTHPERHAALTAPL